MYYWVGCSAWTRLKESNLRFFENRQEAEAAGYTPSLSRGCAGPLPASVWVNRAIVRWGYALITVYPPNVRGVEALRAAADSARFEAVGLWRIGGFECSPTDHRRGRCD